MRRILPRAAIRRNSHNPRPGVVQPPRSSDGQKSSIIQTLDSALVPNMAMCRPSGDGTPQISRGCEFCQMGVALPSRFTRSKVAPWGLEVPTNTLFESGAQSQENQFAISLHRDGANFAARYSKKTNSVVAQSRGEDGDPGAIRGNPPVVFAPWVDRNLVEGKLLVSGMPRLECRTTLRTGRL